MLLLQVVSMYFAISAYLNTCQAMTITVLQETAKFALVYLLSFLK